MLTKPQKIAYSFGGIAASISYQAFSTYIVFFYADVVKLAPWLIAVAMVIYGIWNAINDPIAGYISDRTRSRWGRRKPYIALGFLPLALCFAILWVPPFSAAKQMLFLFIYFIFFISLYDTFYTFVVLNWASLFPEMFPNLEERAEANTYRQSFGLIGLMLGIAVPPLIYGSIGWGWMGMILASAMAGALFISLLGSRERKEYSVGQAPGFFDALKYTLKNRSFLTFVLANLFVQYAFVMVVAIVPFYAKYVLRVGTLQTSLILFAPFILALPAIFMWRRYIVDRGAKKAFLLALGLFAVFVYPLFFVRTFLACVITAGLMGFGLAGLLLLLDILLADVIDEDELNTGVRREGMYFGANALITRIAIGLEAISIAAVLGLTGYDPHLASQPFATLLGLRFLIAGAPIIALVIGILIIRLYPLSGVVVDGMREKLVKLHDEKVKALKV